MRRKRTQVIVPRAERVVAGVAGCRGGFAVRYETALCDRRGRLERILQRGWNMITDFGMNELATTPVQSLLTHLHLSSATHTLKRVLQGGNSLTINHTDPSSIPLTTTQNFFDVATDAGRVLKIAGWPEIQITAVATAQSATGSARNGQWLPGFTPPGNGPFTDVAIHHTNVPTLAAEFDTVNTFDTSSLNFNVSLNDSANSRWIHQRIYLSAPVAGSDLTIQQLGWGQVGVNCFGKANLVTADTVPVDKRYRVTLQVFSAYTPIDLPNTVCNWGPTIGTHTCHLRMHRIPNDTANNHVNPIRPFTMTGGISGLSSVAYTTAQSMESILWEGDPGFNTAPSGGSAVSAANAIFDSGYTSNTHMRTRTFRWPETVTITNATALGLLHGISLRECFKVKPNSGTITKPSGWRMELVFPIHWTRTLIN